MIIRRYVPLAIVVLAGLIVNILAFHIFVDSKLLLLAIVITIFEGILIWHYRENFGGLLENKSKK